MNQNLASVNVERTIGKAEWKRIQAAARFNARIQTELETPPSEEGEEGEEPFQITPESYARTARNLALLASIHKQVDPVIQAKKEARKALFRGRDDAWRVPSKQASCQAEADARIVEEANELAEAIPVPAMQEQDVCQPEEKE